MSTQLNGARAVRLETQPGAVLKKPRKWPDSTPPPVVFRRPLVEVSSEIQVRELPLRSRAAKRTLDVLGSSFGLILLLPLMLVIAALVRLTSKGPALFVQRRCGRGARTFRFYKFRTMVADAEQQLAKLEHLNEMSGPVFKIRQDPRITRLGAFLRKFSLDELPQLWNVLIGDMSLVGPRPPTADEVERYDTRQAQRLSVTPGLTGLWQVSGRSTLPDFDKWLALDLEYVRKQSLMLDLRILVKTVGVVLTAKGAQ